MPSFRGHAFIVDWTLAYLGALVYLALIGSVLAFACYLTLLGRIGADRAAYVTVLGPVVALAVSTVRRRISSGASSPRSASSRCSDRQCAGAAAGEKQYDRYSAACAVSDRLSSDEMMCSASASASAELSCGLRTSPMRQ